MQEIDYAAQDAQQIVHYLWQWAPFLLWPAFRIATLPKPGKLSPDASRNVEGQKLFFGALMVGWFFYYLTNSFDALSDLLTESNAWIAWLCWTALGLVGLIVLVEVMHWRSLRFVDTVIEMQDKTIVERRKVERRLRLLLAAGVVGWLVSFAAMAWWLSRLAHRSG